MNIIVFSIIVLLINLITALYFIRQQNSQMDSMITTMVMTSSFGLSIGFLCWIYFNGQPLTSTLIGTGTGAIVGMLIGMKFGLKCQVEGFFSGLMAAMMGVMLIMMFSISDGLFLLLISLSFLTSMTVFSVARQFALNYRLLIVLCVSVFTIFYLFPSEPVEKNIENHQIHS